MFVTYKSRNLSGYFLDRTNPDVLIHTACSDKSGNWEALLATAALLSHQSNERGIRFIHLSTDHVFNGGQAPYDESHPRCPLTEYGKVKAQAEELIRSLNPHSTIVRTSILYDLFSPDRTFQRILDAETKGEPIGLFTDEIRSPVWVENMADALLELATLDFFGNPAYGGTRTPQSMGYWNEINKPLRHYSYDKIAQRNYQGIRTRSPSRPDPRLQESSKTSFYSFAHNPRGLSSSPNTNFAVSITYIERSPISSHPTNRTSTVLPPENYALSYGSVTRQGAIISSCSLEEI